MGTPEFAIPSLQQIVEAGYEIAGVITAPDRPAGRGMLMQQSAVKQFALRNDMKVLQPLNLKDPQFLKELKELKADLQVVVAFRMLPEVVWDMPPMGTINLHGSLLPQYRGAAPINWAIINGEEETGVTTFKLQHEIDTGNILLQEKITIQKEDTAGSLHDKMKEIGAALLVQTLKEMEHGIVKEKPQPTGISETRVLHHAPKLNNQNCEINWSHPVKNINDQVRGLSPYPAAFTFLNGKKLKIFSATAEDNVDVGTIGTYVTDHKTFLKFCAADGYLILNEIQLEGKKKMKIDDFLRGWRENG